MTIHITEHAFKRLKERSGLNQSAAKRMALKAFENGLGHNECTGNLFKWVSGVTKTSKRGSIRKVYGDKLWIFIKDKETQEISLITVMQIPHNLKDLTDMLMQKKRESSQES